MDAVANRSAQIFLASALYLLLWIPALLLTAFVAFIGGFVGSGFAPLWSAVTFLLTFPAVLLGIKSFRASAIAMVALLAWDIIATTWHDTRPTHILDSKIDILLLTSTALVVLVALVSPFASLIGFVRHLRDD